MLRDPRLDPRIRPDQWAKARRRARWRLFLSVLLILALAGGGAAYYQHQLDRTRNLTAYDLAELAGRAILDAAYYQFTVDLMGDSKDQLFPEARMRGAYQRDPQILHLEGQVLSGESKIDLDYYLEGTDLYLKDPRGERWLLLHDAELEELASFRPDNLAAPLVAGVHSAQILDRLDTDKGPVVVLRLELDPRVMLPQAEYLHQDRTDYKLWVHARTLKPVQFAMQVVRPGSEELDGLQLHFTYRIEWDFAKPKSPLAVPQDIVKYAKEIGSPPEELQRMEPTERPVDEDEAQP